MTELSCTEDDTRFGTQKYLLSNTYWTLLDFSITKLFLTCES